MAILMPLPALLLFLPGLDALRGHQDLAAEQNRSLWGNCRTSKCSGSQILEGAVKPEYVSLKNCRVKKDDFLIWYYGRFYTKELPQRFWTKGNIWCEETCDGIWIQNPAQNTIHVVRRSGHGNQTCSPKNSLKNFHPQYLEWSFSDEAARVIRLCWEIGTVRRIKHDANKAV